VVSSVEVKNYGRRVFTVDHQQYRINPANHLQAETGEMGDSENFISTLLGNNPIVAWNEVDGATACAGDSRRASLQPLGAPARHSPGRSTVDRGQRSNWSSESSLLPSNAQVKAHAEKDLHRPCLRRRSLPENQIFSEGSLNQSSSEAPQLVSISKRVAISAKVFWVLPPVESWTTTATLPTLKNNREHALIQLKDSF
jgi:hypothetical protein